MTAPVESALEHWHKLLSIAHERKHHLDEGLVAIEARDAAVRAAALAQVTDLIDEWRRSPKMDNRSTAELLVELYNLAAKAKEPKP